MQNRLLDVPTMQNKVRFNDISILRVSAMLMVVFCHCLCPYSIWDGTDFYIGSHVQIWKSDRNEFLKSIDIEKVNVKSNIR